MKNCFKIAGLCAVAVALMARSSFALDEQQAPVAQPGATAPSGDAKADVQQSAPAAKAEQGTEIRIPGLGKLGTLPKMDFGLELLYGAAEGKPAEDAVPLEEQPDDVTIRGSVKHRF